MSTFNLIAQICGYIWLACALVGATLYGLVNTKHKVVSAMAVRRLGKQIDSNINYQTQPIDSKALHERLNNDWFFTDPK